MYTVGEQLRQRREARGMGFEPVTRATKLTRTVLVALEEDRFGDLPGEVYTRGFLKIYAEFLEMNTIELVQAYEGQIARGSEFATQDDGAAPASPQLPSYLRDTQTKPSSLTPAGALLLMATAAIAVVFVWSAARRSKATPLVARPTLESAEPATATGPAAPSSPPLATKGVAPMAGAGKGLPPLPGRDLPRR